MSKDQIHREEADKYQELFNLLSQEHGIHATQSQMEDIIQVVRKNHSPLKISYSPTSLSFLHENNSTNQPKTHL